MFWRVDKLAAQADELPHEGEELWIRIPPNKVYLCTYYASKSASKSAGKTVSPSPREIFAPIFSISGTRGIVFNPNLAYSSDRGTASKTSET